MVFRMFSKYACMNCRNKSSVDNGARADAARTKADTARAGDLGVAEPVLEDLLGAAEPL